MERRRLCLGLGILGPGQAWKDVGARPLGAEGTEVELAARPLEIASP